MTEYPRTRLSLFYLAGYLLPAGILLMAAPGVALDLLFAERAYEPTFMRLTGLLLFVVGVLVVQFIRHRVEALYPTTVVLRVLIVGVLFATYIDTGDRLFLILTGVVALGVVLTAASLITERPALRRR